MGGLGDHLQHDAGVARVDGDAVGDHAGEGFGWVVAEGKRAGGGRQFGGEAAGARQVGGGGEEERVAREPVGQERAGDFALAAE